MLWFAGALAQVSTAVWHYPDGSRVHLTNEDNRVMQQIRTPNQNPSYSQLSRYQPNNVALTSALYNGLWTCRHDAK